MSHVTEIESQTKRSNFSTIPKVVLDFLSRTKPFCDLEIDVLESLAVKVVIDFYPKGTRIIEPNVGPMNYLYLIQKGAVKRFIRRHKGEMLAEVCGEGNSYGAIALLQDKQPGYAIEAIEDTFCFLISREDFRLLITTFPSIAEFYLNAFSKEIISSAYVELLGERVKTRNPDSFLLFNQQLGNLIKTQPEIVSSQISIQEAAAKMVSLGATSLLIRNDNEEVVGILTDQDIRSKVVACGLDPCNPVHLAMTTPIVTISSGLSCFDALLEIMSENIDQIVVTDENGIVGTMSSRDILVVQGSSPLFLFRELSTQTTYSGLADLFSKLPLIIRNLIEGGARARDINRTINVLCDRLTARLIHIVEQEIGKPGIPYCFMSLGGWGRQEQIFPTDYDNALILTTNGGNHFSDWDEYFEAFTSILIEQLKKCWYIKNKDAIVASTPLWTKSQSDWLKYFELAIADPDPKVARMAALFFDLRPVFGNRDLLDQLKLDLRPIINTHPVFLQHLADQIVIHKPPISFFRDAIVEKTGQKRGRFDIRTRGLLPIIDFARILALKYEICETNTLDRLHSVRKYGLIKDDLLNDIFDAYEFQMQLVLINQLHQLEAGLPPDYFIMPATLSDLEKRTLREVFRVLLELPSYTKQILDRVNN